MKKHWQTIVFLAVCGAILIFFAMAPEETTPKMPRDSDHMGKHRSYSLCFSCHPPETLPENHVLADGTAPEGKSKCYFCHKLQKPETK